MNSEELAKVESALKSAHGSWHQCAISQKELGPGDIERGAKAGDLCDACRDEIAAVMKGIRGTDPVEPYTSPEFKRNEIAALRRQYVMHSHKVSFARDRQQKVEPHDRNMVSALEKILNKVEKKELL